MVDNFISLFSSNQKTLPIQQTIEMCSAESFPK